VSLSPLLLASVLTYILCIVVDFSNAISNLVNVSKGSTLCYLIVEVDTSYPADMHLMVDSGTTNTSQSGTTGN